MAKNLNNFVQSLGSDVPVNWYSNVWEFVPPKEGLPAPLDGQNKSTWCVPPGVSYATFELWGAGGQAAGGTGPGFSGPSSSGAYAKKRISVIPGNCYSITAGYSFCSTVTNNTIYVPPGGNASGDTYVVGAGLSNLCAQGGCGSLFICANAPNYATLLDSAVPYYPGGEGITQAAYFGADTGVNGRQGYVTTNATLYTVATCNVRWHVPLGAHNLTTQGGFVTQMACCNEFQGTTNQMDTRVYLSLGCALSYYTHDMLAGAGTAGVIAGGATIVCARTNNAGKVKIVYS